MKFKDFCEKFAKDRLYNPLNPRGKDLVEERDIKLWAIYQTTETNKKLVIATWVLAGATIILAIISLLIKYK